MKKYKGLQIDVLGKCGSSIHNSKIPNRAVGWEAAYEILAQQYKFYLSFENAKCYDYITEKLFTAMKVGNFLLSYHIGILHIFPFLWHEGRHTSSSNGRIIKKRL